MIKRELYLSKIRPFYNNELIKVLIGIRRCGKSVLLKQIIDELKDRKVDEDKIVYINFESMKYKDILNARDLHSYIMEKTNENEKFYLFFDEIQNVDEFEKAVNSFRVDIDCDIYITGSNAKLLSSELATHLAGRYVQFRIMPFTYFEVTKLLQKKGVKVGENTFVDYLKFGGMPQRFTMETPSEIETYLNDLYNSIILKDIVQRTSIKDINLLNNMIQYMIENIGQIFSANSISRYLQQEKRQVSPETLYNYVDYIISSLIFSKVNRYDIRGKKILATLEKYYIADLGIRNIKKSNVEFKMGGTLENVVYNELIVRGYEVYIGKSNKKEIDFIATKGEKKIYIQVVHLLATDDVVKREFGVYKNIRDNYPKYVLSMDKFDFSREGIIHMNIVDFLLNRDFIR